MDDDVFGEYAVVVGAHERRRHVALDCRDASSRAVVSESTVSPIFALNRTPRPVRDARRPRVFYR